MTKKGGVEVDILNKENIALLAAGIGATASLAGVVIANLFTSRNLRITSENQNRAKTGELKLHKLEELYFLFDRWQLNYTITYLNHLRFHRHQLKYEDLLSMEAERNRSRADTGDTQKFQMIMNVYFSALAHDYVPVEACRRKITPFLEVAPSKNVSIDEFEKAQIAFENATATFKKKIADLAAVYIQ